MKPEMFNYDQYQVDTVRINPLAINDYICNNHALLAYYGYQQVLWKDAEDWNETILKGVMSDVEIEIREGTEKITESAVKAKVILDQRVKEAQKKLRTCSNQEALYANAIKVIQDRSKQLTNLSNNLRAELGTQHSHIVDREEVQGKGKLTAAEREEILNTAMGR